MTPCLRSFSLLCSVFPFNSVSRPSFLIFSLMVGKFMSTIPNVFLVFGLQPPFTLLYLPISSFFFKICCSFLFILTAGSLSIVFFLRSSPAIFIPLLHPFYQFILWLRGYFYFAYSYSFLPGCFLFFIQERETLDVKGPDLNKDITCENDGRHVAGADFPGDYGEAAASRP